MDCCSFLYSSVLKEESVKETTSSHWEDERDIVHKDHQGNVLKVIEAPKPHPVLTEPVLLQSMLYGLFLVLFGAQFPTIILVWETFLLVGYDKTIEAYNKIKNDMLVTIHTLKDLEAKSKDTVDKALSAYHKKDLSGLSIEDAKHIIEVLRQVDYKHAAGALKTLQVTAMVVMGCLNVQIVKAASLGSSVGETVNMTVHYYIDMILKPFIPSKFWDIISPTITASTYSTSMYLAMFSGTMIQTYQAALKGSSLVSKNVYAIVANHLKFLPRKYAKTICDALAMGLILYSLEFQTMNTLGANAGINMILTPFTMLEDFLVKYNNVQ